MRNFAGFLILLFSAQAIAGPVTYAVKGSSGVTMYTPTTTYTKTLDPIYGQITGPTNAADIATSALVVQKSIDKGFRADDPRVGVTIDAIQRKARDISTGAAASAFGGAAGVVLTGAALGTPVGWGAIAVSALVSGGLAVATPLFVEALDYAIDAATGFISSGSDSPPASGGVYYVQTWKPHPNLVTYIASTPAAAVQMFLDDLENVQPGEYTVTSCNSSRCYVTAWMYSSGVIFETSDGSYEGCFSGIHSSETGLCTPVSSGAAPESKSAPEFFGSPSDAVRAATISSAAMGKLVSELWKEAYKDNPAILPPSEITAGDVDAFRSYNPDIALNGESMTYPPTSAPTTVSPSSPVSTSPGGSTNPGTSGLLQPSTAPAPAPSPEAPKPDLGPDPNIGSPALEQIPTGETILAPVFNLMPDLQSYAVPPHESECPRPSFDAFGNTYTLEAHCTVLDAVKPTLQSVMSAVWVVIAVVIILTA